MSCSKETYYAIYVKITDASNPSEVKFDYLEAGGGSYTVDWNQTCRVWKAVDTDFHPDITPQLITLQEDTGYLWLHSSWFTVPGNPPNPGYVRKRPMGWNLPSTHMWLQLDLDEREVDGDPYFVEIRVEGDQRGGWHRVARNAVFREESTGKTWVLRVAVVSRIVVDYTDVAHERAISADMTRQVVEATSIQEIPRIKATAYTLRVLNDILLEANSLGGVEPDEALVQQWSQRVSELAL